MKTLEILNIVMEKTDYVSSLFSDLLVFQVLLTSCLEIRFYYKSINNKDMLQKVFAAIMPISFIVCCSIIFSLYFGSFISGGMSRTYLSRIADIISDKPFLWELLIIAVLSIILSAIYMFVYRLKWYQFLLTFGLESAALIAGLILFIGLYTERFVFAEVQIPLFRCLVYGYFMVVYKAALTLVSLLGAVLFRDTGKLKPYQKKEYLLEDNFEAYTIKFLNQCQRKTALTFIITMTLFISIIIYGLLLESGLSPHIMNIISVLLTVPFLIPLFAVILLMMCYFFKLAFLPKLTDGYRTLKTDERLFEYFYYEIVQKYSKLPFDKMICTKHFVVVKKTFQVIIELNAAVY